MQRIGVYHKTERARPTEYDIFKGKDFGNGHIQKVKSVGNATLSEDGKTYVIQLYTLPEIEFHIVPTQRQENGADYALMICRYSQGHEVWNSVGEASYLDREGGSFLRLSWDILSATDLYLNGAVLKYCG